MKNFIEWCKDKGLVEVAADGSVSFQGKQPNKSGKKLNAKQTFAGGRDYRKDLSKDYKGDMAQNGTVDPFHLARGKSGSK